MPAPLPIPRPSSPAVLWLYARAFADFEEQRNQCSVGRSLPPKLTMSIIKFVAVNGVFGQERNDRLPDPLLVLKKWSSKVPELINALKAFWKKPGSLNRLPSETASSALWVMLKNPLPHADAFSSFRGTEVRLVHDSCIFSRHPDITV